MTSIEEWGNKSPTEYEIDPPMEHNIENRQRQPRMAIVDALVYEVLCRHRCYAWSKQGFGMYRTKIADVGRIHVWDSRIRAPLVSDVHEHPWDLTSRIVSGELINQRFGRLEAPNVPAIKYRVSDIKTGEGGGLTGETEEVLLSAFDPEFYLPGRTYTQQANEIHRTIAMDGTVTLMTRDQGPPLQATRVYWPAGMGWVTAETKEVDSGDYQLAQAVYLALMRWNPNVA